MCSARHRRVRDVLSPFRGRAKYPRHLILMPPESTTTSVVPRANSVHEDKPFGKVVRRWMNTAASKLLDQTAAEDAPVSDMGNDRQLWTLDSYFELSSLAHGGGVLCRKWRKSSYILSFFLSYIYMSMPTSFALGVRACLRKGHYGLWFRVCGSHWSDKT